MSLLSNLISRKESEFVFEFSTSDHYLHECCNIKAKSLRQAKKTKLYLATRLKMQTNFPDFYETITEYPPASKDNPRLVKKELVMNTFE